MFGRESKQVVVVLLSLVAMDSVESLFRDVSNDFLPTPSTCLLGAGLSNLPTRFVRVTPEAQSKCDGLQGCEVIANRDSTKMRAME
jgi:hypothetical protein